MYEHIIFDIAVDTDLDSSGYCIEIGLNMSTWVRFCIIICILAVAKMLMGCAAYTVANTVTWIATDKSLMDHGSSTLANADCDAVRVIRQGTWYCETRDISTTYNRNAF